MNNILIFTLFVSLWFYELLMSVTNKFYRLRFVYLKYLSLKVSAFLMEKIFKDSTVFEVHGSHLHLKSIDRTVCNSMCGLNKTNLFIFEKICHQNDHQQWLMITDKNNFKKIINCNQEVNDLWQNLKVEDFKYDSAEHNDYDKNFDNLAIKLEDKLNESKQYSNVIPSDLELKENSCIKDTTEVINKSTSKVSKKKINKNKLNQKKVSKKTSKTKSKSK